MANTVRKNLGIVTAYGYARSKGYTGTEEEFAELMASYADVAQDAAHSAEEAAQSAQAAAGSVDQVQGYASQAQQSAQAAATSASDAVDAKTGAQEQVQRAYTQAVAAERSASQSASSAHESAESATAAENSASNASGSAASAQSYADTAAVAAGAASGSAEDAQDSATAAATSAAQAAESARTLTIDTTLTQAGQAADSKKTGDEITSLKQDLNESVGDLKSAINDIYSSVKASDTYRTGVSYEGAGHNTYSGAWDSDTKTASMIIPSSLGSTTSALVYFSPKFLNGHKYKIAVKWDWTNTDTIYYVIGTNRPSISSASGVQYWVNSVVVHKGDIDVYTLDATAEGYLGIGARATSANTFNFKIAVYDVTDIDLTDVSDDVFKTFSDAIVLSSSGLLEDVKATANYSYNLDANTKGEVWSALGDSLTAIGSGSYYLGYTAERLGLSEYNNCGIGGTTISGAENANAMYQDVRINSLDADSQCVTIMGGTNDIWQEYYKDYPNTNYTGWGNVDRTNHDVSTFCGAYNVLISKILYKFCKVSGYYEDVDYTGITQVPTAIDNFRLILITSPQCYHSSGDTISAENKRKGITNAHSYTKQIAELWGLPCVDTWEMGMNDMNKSLFFADASTDGTHINAFAHERLASLLINKAIQVSRYR